MSTNTQNQFLWNAVYTHGDYSCGQIGEFWDLVYTWWGEVDPEDKCLAAAIWDKATADGYYQFGDDEFGLTLSLIDDSPMLPDDDVQPLHVNAVDIPEPDIFLKRYKTPRDFIDITKVLNGPLVRPWYFAGRELLRQTSQYKGVINVPDFCIAVDGVDYETSGMTNQNKHVAVGLAACLSQQPPIYCLDKFLFEQFKQTKPTFLQEPPISSFVLLLPTVDGALINTSTPRQSISFICTNSNRLVISDFIFNVGDIGFLSPTGRCYTYGFGDLIDDDFIVQTVSHAIAYMNSYKDAVEQSESISVSTKGVGFSKKAKPAEFTRPRMISATQKVRVQGKIHASAGTHTSPASHWRRGHWHKYWTGKGRTEEKFNWIEPILVGTND